MRSASSSCTAILAGRATAGNDREADPRGAKGGRRRGRDESPNSFQTQPFHPGFSNVTRNKSSGAILSQLSERLDILASAAHPQLRAACRTRISGWGRVRPDAGRASSHGTRHRFGASRERGGSRRQGAPGQAWRSTWVELPAPPRLARLSGRRALSVRSPMMTNSPWPPSRARALNSRRRHRRRTAAAAARGLARRDRHRERTRAAQRRPRLRPAALLHEGSRLQSDLSN